MRIVRVALRIAVLLIVPRAVGCRCRRAAAVALRIVRVALWVAVLRVVRRETVRSVLLVPTESRRSVKGEGGWAWVVFPGAEGMVLVLPLLVLPLLVLPLEVLLIPFGLFPPLLLVELLLLFEEFLLMLLLVFVEFLLALLLRFQPLEIFLGAVGFLSLYGNGEG